MPKGKSCPAFQELWEVHTRRAGGLDSLACLVLTTCALPGACTYQVAIRSNGMNELQVNY